MWLPDLNLIFDIVVGENHTTGTCVRHSSPSCPAPTCRASSQSPPAEVKPRVATRSGDHNSAPQCDSMVQETKHRKMLWNFYAYTPKYPWHNQQHNCKTMHDIWHQFQNCTRSARNLRQHRARQQQKQTNMQWRMQPSSSPTICTTLCSSKTMCAKIINSYRTIAPPGINCNTHERHV